ncbi:MAG: response regulator [Lachnospiraceae bacterium]|nr:response regulator [Lachnospiraceae bacterium]
MFHTLVIIQIIAIVALVCSLVYIFRGGSTYTQRLMLSFCIAELVHNAGFLLELLAKTQEAAMVAIKTEYLGGSAVAIFFMMFIFNYCGKKEHKIFERILLLCAVAVIVMVWSGDWHTLYYSNVDYLYTGVFPHVKITYGPGFYFYILTCTTIPWVVSVITLFRSIRREKSAKRARKLWIIIGGSAFSFTVLVLYLLKLFPEGYDPTPTAMAFMFSFLVFLVWNRKDFDLSRTATHTVLNSLDDCMITLDENYKVMMFNDVAEKMFPGLEIHRDIKGVEKFPIHVLEAKEPESLKISGKHYEARLRTVLDDEQIVRGFTVLITDVTDTYEYIRELNNMRKEAEEANQSKSDFLANMSHEIRTPMNAIVGMSDLLIEESVGGQIQEYAVDIKTAALNLLAIINDILDLSKVEAGKMEIVEDDYVVSELIEETTTLMKRAAEQKGLEFRVDVAENMPSKLHGDAVRIRQILINLLNNAVKFTKEGYVQLEVAGETLADDMFRLEMVVKDSGIGIKEEDLQLIFESFRQLDMKRNRQSEGTGLGLAITKKLIRLMDGDIQVESEYGKGTTFRVSIKQHKVDSNEGEALVASQYAPAAEMAKKPFTAPDYRVLLVDDNTMNRKVANAMLKTYGFKIAEADCGKAAIERMKLVKYDLILMDHMMPEMDGMEATKIIRTECGENGKKVPIIALTANALQGAREMYLENGFDDFLSKPFDRVQLHELLEKWVPEDARSQG